MQLLRAFVTPFLTRAAEKVASRITFAHAAVFQDENLFARDAAEVTAGEAADGPAHRRIGATEMQEMLLRLVAGDQHHALLGERALALRLDAEKAFQGVDAGARQAPVCRIGPLELGLHSLGHAPTMRESELGQNRTRSIEAEILDQILAQEPHCDRVK